MTRDDGQSIGPGDVALRIGTGLALLFLIAPVVIIALISFDDSRYLSFPPKSFGLRWYRRVLEDPEWRNSLLVSLQVAALTMILATTTGFFAAMALVRTASRRKMSIYAFLLTPMIVPNIVVAIAFYIAFARLGASGSILAMAVGHAVLALPLAVVIMTSFFQGLDERYEQAALNLGASRWQTLRLVTLPLAWPGIASAALFSFLTSFDELLIALFLSGIRAQTLTVRIWNSLSLQLEPTIAAVSTLLIGMTIVILALNAVLQRGSGTRAQ